MHGLLELNETAPANSGARLDVTSAEAKSVKPSTVASGKDDNNKGDTPTVPTQPTTPETPSTDDKTDNTQKPSQPTTDKTTNSVKTGNNTVMSSYAIMMLLAAGAYTAIKKTAE